MAPFIDMLIFNIISDLESLHQESSYHNLPITNIHPLKYTQMNIQR